MNTTQKYAGFAGGLFLALAMFVGANSAMADVVLPSIATTSADQITATSARLMGSLSSLGTEPSAVVKFEYGPTASYGTSTTSGVISDAPSIFGYTIGDPSTSLTCGTAYHYRAVADSTDGTAYGDDMTFATLPCPAPTITTVAALAVTPISETFQGTYLDSTNTGGPMTVGFDYGTTTAYGSVLTSAGPLSAGNTFTLTASDLTCATAYHFRAFGTDASSNTIYGADMTFTAMPCVAVVTTAATGITQTTAVVGGILNQSTLTPGAIQVGVTVGTSFMAVTPHAVLGPFSYTATGLTCATDYSFYAYATDGVANVSGATLTFTTLACAGGGSGGGGGGGSSGGTIGGSGGTGSGGGQLSGTSGSSSASSQTSSGSIGTSNPAGTTDASVSTASKTSTNGLAKNTSIDALGTAHSGTSGLNITDTLAQAAGTEEIAPAPLAASAIGSGFFSHMRSWMWILGSIILIFLVRVSYKKYRKSA